MRLFSSSRASLIILHLTKIIIILITINFLSCAHVAHDADVEEGIQASMMLFPTNALATDKAFNHTQWNISYGHKFKNGRKSSIGLYLVSTRGDNRWTYLPSLDLYFQNRYSNPYGGFGVIVSMDPSLYYMWGSKWQNNNSRAFAMSYLTGIGIIGSFNLQMKLSWQFENVYFGPSIQYRYIFMQAPQLENSSNTGSIGHLISIGIVVGLNR